MTPMKSVINIELAGESVLLLAQKALVWPREKTLFVADVHLGKAASFRAAGVPVPSGHSRDDLARLSALIDAHHIAHLVVLGDLVHDRASYTAALDAHVAAFRSHHAGLKCTLIMGNHDDKAGAPPVSWGLDVVFDYLSINPFIAAHAPISRPVAGRSLNDSMRLCGHIHPAAWVRTSREAIHLPCFWQTPGQLVLPSFGALTGRYVVQPQAGDVTYVVTGQHIFQNPTRAL
jgi:uncharacterized protein